MLNGIEAAVAAGLAPIKVNAVIKRGANEQEILPLVRHFRHSGIILRFIEFMDVGATNGWRLDDVIAAEEILKVIHAEFPLEPIDPQYRGEVAQRAREGGCAVARIRHEGEVAGCRFSG